MDSVIERYNKMKQVNQQQSITATEIQVIAKDQVKTHMHPLTGDS